MSKLIGYILTVYNQLIERMLAMVAVIKSLNPAYKQPGDGSNGTCDCIGLIIGALSRMGIKWPGIHGSNYAARYQTVDLAKIQGAGSLELGDMVFKAREKGTKKWKLPDRYLPGKSYYTGDLKDYYHVGVVTKVNPLNITHMTSPRMKVDTNLSGGWNYHGKNRLLVERAKQDEPQPQPAPVPAEPVPSTGSRAIVTADNKKPVKMREYPSTSCGTWIKIPCGTEVTIVEPGEKWAKINGYGRKGWYMMAQYLDVIGDGKGKY